MESTPVLMFYLLNHTSKIRVKKMAVQLRDNADRITNTWEMTIIKFNMGI